MKKLQKYRKKRDFLKTSEPVGNDNAKAKGPDGGKYIFAVQHHLASHDHYDLRLQWRGVLISFAVPKGPSFNPRDKRLAVHVEDHPLEYADFEGIIPEGEYGGGTVMLWDFGTFQPIGSFSKGLKSGSLKFVLFGSRLKGRWALVRLKEEKNWLLIKELDEFAQNSPGIEEFVTSVKTGRTMQEIASNAKIKIGKNNKNATKTGENAGNLQKIKLKKSKNVSKDFSNKSSDVLKNSSRKSVPKNPFQDVDVQLCTLADVVPSGEDYVFEVKYDGYRIVAFAQAGKVRLITRNQTDFSEKFSVISQQVQKMAHGHSLILDGEIIVPDEGGRPDFQALQNFMRSGKTDTAIYMIFDILALDGQDLRRLPLVERKQILHDFWQENEEFYPNLKYAEHFEGDGKKFFKAVEKMGLEGVVAKRRDSKYAGVRNDDWLKIKCYRRQEFVIGGFLQSDKKDLSAIILGYYDNDQFRYAGKCGTGFDEHESKILLKKFHPIICKKSPFSEQNIEILITKKTMWSAIREEHKKTKIFWLKPKYVAEIQFAEVTKDGVLRQASFKGLREDKTAQEVVLEVPRENSEGNSKERLKENLIDKSNNKVGKHNVGEIDKKISDKTVAKSGGKTGKKNGKKVGEIIESHKMIDENDATNFAKSRKKTAKNATSCICGIEISHPNKILFKKPRVTKEDVAQYYASVSSRMLPFVKGRILSVVRCHNTLLQGFYKKHPTAERVGITKVIVTNDEGEKGEYFAVENEQGLLEQVQLGTLEFHMWGSHVRTLEKPDYMVFDFDPDKNLDLQKVRQGVKDLKKVLDKLNLVSFLKTSGGKGYHVCVPFQPAANWKNFHDFSEKIAHLLESKYPERYTTNIRKNNRKGKIFIDFMRNTRTATSVAPYSLRARPGAKVSCPIFWSELDKIAPADIDLHAALERLSKKDPWANFHNIQQHLNSKM